MKQLINWKLFCILLGASVFGVIAVLPYTLTLQANLLKELPIPLHILLSIQLIQNTVMLAIFIFIGLYFARKVGLGAPILEGWLEGKKVNTHLKSILSILVGLGVLVGIIIIAIDFLFSVFVEPITNIQVTPPIWGSAYVGICNPM